MIGGILNTEPDPDKNFFAKRGEVSPAFFLAGQRRAWKSAQVFGGRKMRLGVLGSGKGSNMVAIADACAGADCPYEIVTVLSDVENAGILERARERRLKAEFIPPGQYRTKLDEQAERRFIAALRQAEVDFIALAGFMRILKGEFLREFAERVINIHPSLLPAFPGLEAWRQALDYGVKVTGCTAHFVDQGIDSGAIIAQATVPVREGDTAETLHARIQLEERKLYPEALRWLATGKVKVEGRRCRVAA